MDLMRKLSITLVLLALFAVSFNLTQPQRYHGLQAEVGQVELASLSESPWRLPADEVKEAFSKARQAMFERNRTGARFAQLATAASWFNIACSIIITIALGWAGKSVTPSEAGTKAHLVGLTPAWAKLIGFAAALSGASAFAGNEASQYAEQRYESARSLHGLIVETRRALSLPAGDEISQREALDRLLLEAQRP